MLMSLTYEVDVNYEEQVRPQQWVYINTKKVYKL